MRYQQEPNVFGDRNFSINFNEAHVIKALVIDALENLDLKNNIFRQQSVHHKYLKLHMIELISKLKDHFGEIAKEIKE